MDQCTNTEMHQYFRKNYEFYHFTMHTVILKTRVFFADKCAHVKTGKFANREEPMKIFSNGEMFSYASLNITWNQIFVFLLREIFSVVLVDKDFQISRFFVHLVLVSFSR